MRTLPATSLVLACAMLGCQREAGPIFPQISPPIVWPTPPDQPRIRYIGQLVGEASLQAPASGWETLQEVLGGPRAQIAFSRPTAVAVRGERVYVTDVGLGVVHVLDLDTRAYDLIRGTPDERFLVPIDVAILPPCESTAPPRVAVVDRKRAAVDLFSITGEWLHTARWDDLPSPTSITWHAPTNTIWLVDATTHQCIALSDNLEIVQRFGARGIDPLQFNYPSAITADETLDLVIADAMNFRVQIVSLLASEKVDPPHTPVATVVFGQKGDAAGDFARPRDVAVDEDHHIYVLDNQFENIQIFDRAGQLLLAFGAGGDQPGQFSLPAGITIDKKSRIWVADSYNRRVQVFEYLAESASWDN